MNGAQAILESGWGKSYLAQKANNIFGMKAVISGNNWIGTTWDGKSYIRLLSGEEYGGKKVKVNSNFRKYNTEVILAGSGFNGINRDTRAEDYNKRFVLQIIPKINRPAPNANNNN